MHIYIQLGVIGPLTNNQNCSKKHNLESLLLFKGLFLFEKLAKVNLSNNKQCAQSSVWSRLGLYDELTAKI